MILDPCHSAVWEMYHCETLYEGLMEAQIYHGVSEGILRPVWDDAVPPGLKDLACSCWDQQPANRYAGRSEPHHIARNLSPHRLLIKPSADYPQDEQNPFGVPVHVHESL
jgi:hypothetical protein